jgi:hypothetical protein
MVGLVRTLARTGLEGRSRERQIHNMPIAVGGSRRW